MKILRRTHPVWIVLSFERWSNIIVTFGEDKIKLPEETTLDGSTGYLPVFLAREAALVYAKSRDLNEDALLEGTWTREDS